MYMHFTLNRTPQQLIDLYSEDTILRLGVVAGSYANWLCVYDPAWLPNDIDIWTFNPADYEAIKRNLQNDYSMIDENPVCARFSPNPELYTRYEDCAPLEVNLISPMSNFEAPEHAILLDTFDLTCSRGMVLRHPVDGFYVLAHEEFMHPDARVLLVNRPLKSIQRVIKYSQRGYRFAEWEILKLLHAWDQVSDASKAGLIDQAREKLELEAPVAGDGYDDDDCEAAWDYEFEDDDRWELEHREEAE